MTTDEQILSLIDEVEKLNFQLKAADSDNLAKDKEIAELKQQLEKRDELIDNGKAILKPIEPLNEVLTVESILDKYLEKYNKNKELFYQTSFNINQADLIGRAMQEHTNIHLDKFAEYVAYKLSFVLSEERVKELLTEYKNKLK